MRYEDMSTSLLSRVYEGSLEDIKYSSKKHSSIVTCRIPLGVFMG